MTESIGLLKLMNIIKSHLFLIFLTFVLGLGGAYIVTEYLFSPIYASSTKLLVSHPFEENQRVSLGEIESNIQLINTYRDIIEDPVILDRVLEIVDVSYSTEELREKITILTSTDSQIFKVEVKDTDSFRSAQLSNAIAETFQEEVGEIVNVENVAILSPARINARPVSPNLLFNMVIGGIIGLLIGIALSISYFLLDKRIHNEEDVFQILDWTNLGAISHVDKKDLQNNLTYTVEHTVTKNKENHSQSSLRSRKEKNHVSYEK